MFIGLSILLAWIKKKSGAAWNMQIWSKANTCKVESKQLWDYLRTHWPFCPLTGRCRWLHVCLQSQLRNISSLASVATFNTYICSYVKQRSNRTVSRTRLVTFEIITRLQVVSQSCERFLQQTNTTTATFFPPWKMDKSLCNGTRLERFEGAEGTSRLIDGRGRGKA